MLCHLLAFMIAMLLCQVTATPYFKPWLETRQSPTLVATSNLIYPPNNDKTTCPQDPNNLFAGYNLGVATSKKRSLHQTFRVPDSSSPSRRLQPRQLSNGSCTTVASFSFTDWEQSYDANTATIPLAGGAQYTFSIAANVDIKKLEAWSKVGNNWKVLNSVSPNAKNTTLITAFAQTTSVHWKIYFRYGHPNGNVAVFSNKAPPSNAIPFGVTKRKRAAYAFTPPKPP